jgi:thioredoxin-related protein
MKLQLNLKLLFLAIFLLISCGSFSQQSDIPKNIPVFKLVLSDGKNYFNSSQIEKNKPLMLIYFDPDCDHCKQFAANLDKNFTKFSKVQIIMICASPNLYLLKKFAVENKISTYPNVKIGTEGIYHPVMNFYHVQITPFTALYDSKGMLVASYRNMPAIEELAAHLKK